MDSFVKANIPTKNISLNIETGGIGKICDQIAYSSGLRDCCGNGVETAWGLASAAIQEH